MSQLSLGARLVVWRALRTGIFVLSKKYAAPSLTLDAGAGVGMDGWRWGEQLRCDRVIETRIRIALGSQSFNYLIYNPRQ